ncbi:MAG: anhydro-N-acetylmuramic acid kinase [Bacillota bacterium]|nr:MAG: anhydro-N-acetylmuramic acid kinase [Bacillota bacterium]
METRPAGAARLLAIANKPERLVLGLMSGTSVDGIDAALVRIRGGGADAQVELVAFCTYPYPPGVRERILALCDPATSSVDAICHLNFVVGECFAQAALALCRDAGVDPAAVDLVGSHGQTIWHQPDPIPEGDWLVRSTLQIGEPAVIAERLGCPVVADFRTRDMAAGGQGAPLVPYFDWVMLRHPRLNRAVQNIGGIGNVTYLPAGGGLEQVVAFDTGPGNMLIDGVVTLLTRGRQTYDADGRLAARGQVDPGLLGRLMAHPYLQQPPPRTTGREVFGLPFCRRLLQEYGLAEGTLVEASGEGDRQRAWNLVATVTAFTAHSIADAYRRFLPGPVDEVLVAGGGARNPTLMRFLQEALGEVPVRLMDELGINADAKEAMAFALLANDALLGLPTNVPGATGGRPSVLGKVVL